MKTIAVITGSRSDFGLLEPLILKLSQRFRLLTISLWDNPENTEIKIESLPNSDSLEGTCTSMALTLLKLPQYLKQREVDCAVVLGDRYEVLAASVVMYNLGIPIAHIEGSDTTLGSLDEGYRAAIRALATLHFDIEEYGSLGCVFPITPKINFEADYILIYHPYKGDWKREFGNLVGVAKRLPAILAFKANNDAGGKEINEHLEKNMLCMGNISRAKYTSLLKQAKFIIGNSSSGIIEAPSLKVPTINVGDRQAGRWKANSIYTCEGNGKSIWETIDYVLARKWTDEDFKNPYEKPNTVKRITSNIESFLQRRNS